jgi:hypothetical protein
MENYTIKVHVLCRRKYSKGYQVREYNFNSHAHLERWKEKWWCVLGIDQIEIIEDKTIQPITEAIQKTQPMKTMFAKYKGKCNSCSAPIAVGDSIGYDTQLRKAICSSCNKTQAESEQRSTEDYIAAQESAYYDQWYTRNAENNETEFSNWNTH